MERFFLGVLTTDPLAVLCLLVAIILGAFLASRLRQVNFKFRRVTYFWYGQLLFLTFAALQIGTVFMTGAINYGLFVPFCILILSIYVLFGAGIYIGSAARANHISGETAFAWLAFIPIANFWLVFQPGEKDQHWHWSEHGIKDSFIVAIGLIPGLMAAEILSELGEGSFGRRALHAFEATAQSTQEKASFMALSFDRGVVSPCPYGMSVADAEATESILSIRCITRKHGLLGSVEEVNSKHQTERFCGSSRYRSFLTGGGQFSIEYAFPGNRRHQNLSIVEADCVS